MPLGSAIVWGSALLGGAATGYALLALAVVEAFARRVPSLAAMPEPVTLLKPLHGAEPRLAENLASFLDQDWAAPIELLAGVAAADDPAAPALPEGGRLIVAGRAAGANAKIATLARLAPAASHELLVLSDSDIAVPRDYLAILAGALAEPGAGAVTCLYRGRADGGVWARLGAARISYDFLPSVLVSLALGAAAPCMGSTIALRRSTLERIGGFDRFGDVLADDHAIGAAVRALGLRIVVPRLIVVHACAEPSLAALFRHELRWAVTVRGLAPWLYPGTLVTHLLPLMMLLTVLRPFWGVPLLGIALVLRLLTVRRVDRLCGARTAPAWLLPVRDLLSFAVFVASFFVRTVEWRGDRLALRPRGGIAAERR